MAGYNPSDVIDKFYRDCEKFLNNENFRSVLEGFIQESNKEHRFATIGILEYLVIQILRGEMDR